MAIKIEVPEEHHIKELVKNMSWPDKREVLALGADPEWAVRFSIENSVEAVAISEDEGLGCIVGLVFMDGLEPQTYPWLLGTDLVQKYRKATWSISKQLIDRWTKRYPLMTNLVDARNQRALIWLRRLGAEIEPASPVPPYGRLFHRFNFRSEPCASLR